MPDSTDKNISTLVSELWELVLAYARQETVDPLKALVRFVAWGVAGSVLLGVGAVLISIGILRVIEQEAVPQVSGHLSWVPYAGAAAFAVLGLGLSARAVGTDRRRLERQRAALREERG